MRRIFFAGLAVMMLGACGGDDGGNAAQEGEPGTEVTVKEFKFEPQEVEVIAGGTVTWTNEDSTDHSIAEPRGAFQGDPFGPSSPEKTFSRTYDTKGSFPYFCGIHNSMMGTVNVT